MICLLACIDNNWEEIIKIMLQMYFKKIDKFDIIYNNFYNELLPQNKSLNRTQSYSLQCYLCHVEMLE